MSRARQRARKPIALDVFAGAGGLSLGLQQAGFKVAGAIEKDSLAAETYRKNFPKTKLWESDVKRVSGADVRRKLGLRKGQLDLLAGCPPCQGFSSVRTLNGGRRIVDPVQKSLLFHILRFARVLRPKTIMLENVPGLQWDRRWEEFVSELERIGFSCISNVLNAAEYGVPQRRRRLILLATRFSRVDFAAEAPQRLYVRDAIKGLRRPGKSGDPLHDMPENRSRKVLQRIRNVPKNGGSRSSLGSRFQLGCHKRCDGFKDIYGRMKWSEVSPTITSGCVNPSKGRFLHPTANRAITLREAALLQSFPKDYYFGLSRGKHAAARLIGNALPPEFIRRHAAALVAIVARRNRPATSKSSCHQRPPLRHRHQKH